MNLPGWSLEVPDIFAAEPEHDNDVIACCKRLWSDTSLAHAPFLALRHSYLDQMGGRLGQRRERPATR